MKSLLRNAFFRADVSIDGMFSPKLSPASPSTMLRRNFGICLWSLGASADLKFKKWILKPMALTGARRIAGRVASALVLIVCATSNAAWGQSLDELYAKARNEKTLELYTGGLWRPLRPLQRNSNNATLASTLLLLAASVTCLIGRLTPSSLQRS